MASFFRWRTPAFWLLVAQTVYSIRKCGPDLCPNYKVCCTPRNHSAVTCCKKAVDTTYVNISTITRKLSGILVVLLLFTLGYLIHRFVCSKSRRRRRHHAIELDTPEGFHHPTTTLSREPLFTGGPLLGPPAAEGPLGLPVPAAALPTYEECVCTGLPTYEESLCDRHVHHSEGDNISGSDGSLSRRATR